MVIKSDGMTGYKGAVSINKATNRPFLAMVALWIPEGVDIVVPKTRPDCVVFYRSERAIVKNIFYRSERAIVKNITPYYDGIFLSIGDPIDWDHTATSLFEWSSILSHGLMLNLDFADLFSPSYLKRSLPTLYKVGAEVVADTLDVSEDEACASGIHFFGSIREAEIYFRDGWWPSAVIDGIRQRIQQH